MVLLMRLYHVDNSPVKLHPLDKSLYLRVFQLRVVNITTCFLIL